MKKFWLNKILRYGVNAAGAAIIANGYAEEGLVQEAMGAAMVLLSFAVSVFQSQSRIRAGNQRI